MKKTITALVISVLLITGILFITDRALKAQTNDSSSDMMKKLDDILANQKSIMQAIASMKEELYLIKIRVTQSQ